MQEKKEREGCVWIGSMLLAYTSTCLRELLLFSPSPFPLVNNHSYRKFALHPVLASCAKCITDIPSFHLPPPCGRPQLHLVIPYRAGALTTKLYYHDGSGQ